MLFSRLFNYYYIYMVDCLKNNTVNELNWNKLVVRFRNKTVLSYQLSRNSFRERLVFEDVYEPVTKT